MVDRSLLETEITTPAPLVLLNSGREGPPVFLCPGIGGRVMDLELLVRSVQSNQSIYGMEPLGNSRLQPLLESIEATAEFFLGAIQELQPKGPYFLIGYSLGGLITLEIAQRLRMAGESIALLGMIDTYPDRRQLPWTQHARLMLQLARLRISSRSRVTAPNQSGAREEMSAMLERSKVAQYRALRNYRPRRYEGIVKFARAAVPTYFPADPAAFWRPLVNEFEMETVPGDHVGMITTKVDALGSVVTRWIQQARASG